jgi:AAA+ ATPase superfamily predicted ATPase
MKYLAVRENLDFVGRNRDWRQLESIDALDEATIIVIYGRRRVGKTELIEQLLDRFIEHNPQYRRYTFETALITSEPASETLPGEGFFTYLITAEELFAKPGAYSRRLVIFRRST